jgi:hypothetical protein
MPENELIIRHKGKEYDFELTERDADRMSNITAVIEYAPFDQTPPYPATNLTEEQQEQDRKRHAEYAQTAIDFQAQIKRIAGLAEYQMPLLLAFLDVIELGDLGMSDTNWMAEFITGLLHSVIHHGAARALHQDPRGFLADLSRDMYNYWSWVRDSRDLLKDHPEFFPAPPVKPEPAPKASATPKPAKRQRARKGRKAA